MLISIWPVFSKFSYFRVTEMVLKYGVEINRGITNDNVTTGAAAAATATTTANSTATDATATDTDTDADTDTAIVIATATDADTDVTIFINTFIRITSKEFVRIRAKKKYAGNITINMVKQLSTAG